MAVLALVVPTALWLLLVWDTRPYSDQEVEADRARVEALPAYQQDVEDCRSLVGDLGSACDEIAFTDHTGITREPLILVASESLWVTLGLAALAFVIGVRWPRGRDVRGFVADGGRLFVLGAGTALAISLVWWWGLETIAEHRRLEVTQAPLGVALRAAAFVGGSTVLGLACAQLLRGMVGRVVALSVTAAALGLVMPVARPVAPWLPVLNAQAFLVGDASYAIPRDQVVCTPSEGYAIRVLPVGPAASSEFESCTPDHRIRTSGGAAVYLLGATSLLLAAAALTRSRRRTAAAAV